MKKLLMGSVALILFSVSVVVFQVSCSKDAMAGNDDDNGGKGKMVLYKISTDAGGDQNNEQLWLMESNGSNRHRVNIVFPQNDFFITSARLVDKGTKIILFAIKFNEVDNYRVAYKCNLDGSGLTQLFQGAQFDDYQMQDVY
jgi:hypothetical protein